ncbi:hypothetical protein L1049_017128 [Liquidambar formosana]|uniref:C3H1-type domain-containing protein n=1 Tax=Liquidambar formosana TaxID=63359 RepID=A0AAP0X3X9_LIQFO
MDRYGRAPAPEGSQSDPAAEWTGAGGETGLEESMWHLGLGGGGSVGGGGESYPERPDESDCNYYLRTGFCGYGARCRFNHPRDRSAVGGALRHGGGEFPERVGQPVCQYYMRTGTCKYGASCKYHHPKHGGGSPVSPVSVNCYGYPLRLGEKECSYYMKTGNCKFGMTCKFHHPQPAGISQPSASPAPGAVPMPSPVPATALYPTMQSQSVPSSQQYGVVAGNWQLVRHPHMVPGSYIQGPYGPVLLSSGMVPFAGWSPYPAPTSPAASPSTQPTVGSASLYGITHLSPSAPAYTGAFPPIPSSVGPSSSSQREHIFPERPGQTECHYYMKTGDCKFGSSCRYHHPPELITPKTNFSLSPMNLPLRPGAPPCSYYAQHGVCKFGPTCKYDHPMGPLRYSPSASSLADMPVAPYPVGSTVGTLAPSSSSSELRPELNSGSSKDSSSTRMSSSMSTSSGSVGSIFSKGGPVPHSSVQQSGHSSGPSNGSSSTEAHTSS